jgi:hypothetical protein
VLKKMQVMLPMWMSDHIDRLSAIHELSASEFMRLQLCFSIIAFTTFAYPEYKTDFPLKTICSKTLKLLKSDDRESYLRFLSDVYFEARKAVEFRIKGGKL